MNAALKTSMNGESRNAPLLDVAIEAKRFGPVPVIRDVTLAVPRGEITALVGPSGCGKSTLLRIVAGLDRQFNGHCRVLGKPARLHSGHVGFIFQEPRLLPWLTVADNVGFEAGRDLVAILLVMLIVVSFTIVPSLAHRPPAAAVKSGTGRLQRRGGHPHPSLGSDMP